MLLAVLFVVALAAANTVNLGWGLGLAQEVPGLTVPIVAQAQIAPDLGPVSADLRVIGALHRADWTMDGQVADGYGLAGLSIVSSTGVTVSAGGGVWSDELSFDAMTPAVYGAMGFDCGPVHRLEVIGAMPMTAEPGSRSPALVAVLASVGF